jgi:hypothetical protein
MLPSVVARLRNHKNTNSICIINLFFGWTILGWVICLAWSASSNVHEKQKPKESETKPHEFWTTPPTPKF